MRGTVYRELASLLIVSGASDIGKVYAHKTLFEKFVVQDASGWEAEPYREQRSLLLRVFAHSCIHKCNITSPPTTCIDVRNLFGNQRAAPVECNRTDILLHGPALKMDRYWLSATFR